MPTFSGPEILQDIIYIIIEIEIYWKEYCSCRRCVVEFTSVYLLLLLHTICTEGLGENPSRSPSYHLLQ